MQSSEVVDAAGIGDFTFTGWLITFAYLAAAYTCFLAWVHAYSLGPNARRLQVAWIGLGLAMTALGLNKQLDLQWIATMLAKEHALAHGWYEGRRALQRGLFVGVVLAGLGVAAAIGWYMRRHVKHFVLAGAGLALLGLFIVVRAAAFEHITGETAGWINALLELAGIGCVALNARRFARKRLRQKQPSELGARS